MSRFLKFLIFFIVILMILLGIFLLLSPQITKFINNYILFEKEIVSFEEFKKVMENNRYDFTKEISEDELDNYMENLEFGYMTATDVEGANQCNYWKFDDENYSYYYFYRDKILLKKQCTGLYVETYKKYKNGNIYSIKNEEKYIVIIQIDDMIICINNEIDNEGTAQKIINELGY